MYFQTKTLPISLLEHAIDPKQNALFRSWRKNELGEKLLQYADDLALLTIDANTKLPIELFTGRNSLANKVLGNSWQADLAKTSGSEKILEAYDIDRFGEPTFQYVCHNGKRNGDLFDVAYERLVLPFKVGGGLPQFVTLSTVVSFEIQPIGEQSRDNGASPSRTANSQILLGTAQFSS